MLTLTLLLAIAQTQPAAPAAEPAPEPVKKEKKLCRTNGMTGTRLGPTKACHTAAEWADIDARNAADNNLSRGAGANRY